MATLTWAVEWLSGIVWGVPMLVLLLGVGIYLTIGLRFLTLRDLPFAFGMLWRGRAAEGKGEITPFNALMTALAATIGTGNIAGVATAITFGGPGAIFWMWMTALVGMATKFAEAVLAVRYREVDEGGHYVGGPMYYIKNGLGPRWAWLGACFAAFAGLAGFGIGNTVQANSVAAALEGAFGVPLWVTGVVLALLVALVLIGGIKRIASVAGALVPLMAISYIGAGSIVLGLNAEAIPGAFRLIFEHAFSETAATGGFAGAAVWAAIRYGVARGVFSNEAGLGSAPIAHAAAECKGPVSQGLVAMLGTFIDTIVVCTFTGAHHSEYRRLDKSGREDRGGIDIDGVPELAAERGRSDYLRRACGLCLHVAPRLELLLRAVLAISARHESHRAVSCVVVSGTDPRGDGQAGLHLAARGRAECIHGDPQSDRARAPQPGGVRRGQGVFRYTWQVGRTIRSEV